MFGIAPECFWKTKNPYAKESLLKIMSVGLSDLSKRHGQSRYK